GRAGAPPRLGGRAVRWLAVRALGVTARAHPVSLRKIVVVTALVGLACRQDMHDQPRYKPYAKSDFFGDARSARPQVEDTVARGQLRDDPRLYAGKEGAQPVPEIPLPITIKLVRRGQERYRIYCTPC